MSSNKFFKFGAPFLLLVVGGSFGLKEFAQLRYKYSKKTLIRPEELEQISELKKPEKVTLESEYDKIKGLADQEWENIRGPRPWEPETIVKH